MNDRFDMTSLKLKDGQSLDHESEATVDVIVTASDGTLSSTETFTLTVTDVNEAPTDISLSATSVAENAAGAEIGTLSATDPESDAITFSVSDDRFEVVNDTTLKLKDGQSLDHESEATVDVIVTASDGTLSSTETFTLTVTDVNEAPTDISLSATSVAENAAGAGDRHAERDRPRE